MDLTAEKWQWLNEDQQSNIITSALIPPPISLDIWAKAASQPSVMILQLAEKLVSSRWMAVYEPLGLGNYFYKDSATITAILQWADNQHVGTIAQRLSDVFHDEYPSGPKLWLALAYLSQIVEYPIAGPQVLIKAAAYCKEARLQEDAATYYRLAIDSRHRLPENQQEKEAYIDAVLGLCHCSGRIIPFSEQKCLLSRALEFCDATEGNRRKATVLANMGQVSKALGNYENASVEFEAAWCLACKTASEELIKSVALASTDFLMWQGRIAEAIERYEQVLGNLEELPSDESSLNACALLGWMYGKCGQTVRGIGLINAVSEKAGECGFEKIKIYSKVMTVNTLHDARRNGEAEPLINELKMIPVQNLDHLIQWPLCAAKAYELCSKGEYEESFRMQQEAYANAKKLGNFHHRGPINFEYMDILEEQGYIHPEMNYDSEVKRVINWPDTYMQGVGYYFRAKRTVKKNGSLNKARRDLAKSIELLTRSGAALDLAYTQILCGRLLLQSGDREKAARLLKKAWKTVRFANEKIFPEDLKQYVQVQSQERFLLDSLIKIGETLGTIRNSRKLLKHIISLTMQLTGAERGAFFVHAGKGGVEMTASRNIEPELFQTKMYASALASIEEVMRSGQEKVTSTRPHKTSESLQQGTTGWHIIYPVKLRGIIMGTFFLERNLSGPGLSQRALSMLKSISTQVAVALDNARAYEEIAELKDQLEAETLFYRSDPSKTQQSKDIVGESPAIREVLDKIYDVAPSDTAVLITGETGVGKELVAKAIHQLSRRAKGPFIPVSIASLDEGLLASELFGHEKGAFTNALRTHRGRFELADQGTLFLDEINSLSLDVQAKLLRVLEEKAFERVGGSSVIRPDFRLIAATNHPLELSVKKGSFRADLYYRLNVYPIEVPALRKRKEDIPLLISYFVNKYNEKFSRSYKNVNKRSMQNLMGYPWPGNVRELKHTVERAVLSCKERQLNFPEFNRYKTAVENTDFFPLKEMERRYILKALEKCGWKVSGDTGAAQLLGLNPQTLYSKIKRLGIRKKVVYDKK